MDEVVHTPDGRLYMLSDKPLYSETMRHADSVQPWWKRRWRCWWQEQVLLLEANSSGGQWILQVNDAGSHAQIWSGTIDTGVGPRQLKIQWGPGSPWIPPTLYPIEHFSCAHQYRDGAMCLLAPHGPENGWGGVPDITFWLKRARGWFEAFVRERWAIPPALWAMLSAQRPLPGYRTGVSSANVILLPPEWEDSIPPEPGEFEVLAPHQSGKPWVMWRWRLNSQQQWQEWRAAMELVAGDKNIIPGVWVYFDHDAMMTTGGLHPFRRKDHEERYRSVLDRVTKSARPNGTQLIVGSRVRHQGQTVSPWTFTPFPEHARNDSHGFQNPFTRWAEVLKTFDTVLKTFDATLKATRQGLVLAPLRLASRRNAGREDELKQKLLSAHVCLVGCGALGSEVAHLLAQEGIGQFTLMDGDLLLPENVARHRCDLSAVGQAKVDAVRASILRINPQAKVDTCAQFVDEVLQSKTLKPRHHSDGWSESAERDCTTVTLVVGMTGDEASEGLLSDICSAARVPTLQGWLEMKGQVLRLFRCLPDLDPSMLELQTSPQQSVPALPRSQEDSLPTQCAELVLPGSPLLIHAAANFVVQQVLKLLSGGREEFNHWLFAPMGVSHPSLDPRLAALTQPYGSARFRL